ncbi:MAG: T9SS type A sorting domain-containing protein [Bacteroidales bacterium]|jgi:hypothetical protein
MRPLKISKYISTVLVLGILVQNIFAQPFNIDLSPQDVDENEDVGTTIGLITANTFNPPLSFSLTGPNAGYFDIDGSNNLITNTVFDRETTSTIAVTIQATDLMGSNTSTFTITINDVNEAPDAISISPSSPSVDENQTPPNYVATISSSDPDVSFSHTYSITGGDESFFDISGTDLVTDASFDYEDIDEYTITIRATDDGNSSLYIQDDFTIFISDANDAPTDIDLSSNTVAEGLPADTPVGTLSTTDEDAGDDHIYSVITGGSYFNISGNELRTSQEFDYEAQPFYDITIRTRDDGTGNLTFDKDFTINVTNVSTAPVLDDLELTTLQYTEEDPPANITSSITVTDEDGDDITSATVSITGGRVTDEDRLALASTPFSSTINYNTSSGVLTISGTGTPAQYQTALREVTYENINDEDPDEGTRTIAFQVSDGSPSNTVSRQLEVNGENDPPVATNVVITGTDNKIGTLQTGDYDYEDPEDGTTEGESTYQWYSANTSGGSGRAAITGETNLTFIPDFTEGGKYIQFEVTPVDLDDLAGDPETSSWKYINAAPVFTDLTVVNDDHPGVFAVGETIRANTDSYDDEENDPAGTHTYQWYRSNTGSWPGTVLSGETGSTYELALTDNNRYIAVEVVPVATDGSSPGEVHQSPWYPVGQLPSATISGDTAICDDGSDGTLTVTLTGTNPPWSFSYTVNGGAPTEVNNVSETNYDLNVSAEGTYELTEVSDAMYDFGIVSGQGTISYRDISAAISGNETICEGTSFDIEVELTGVPDWEIIYQYDSEDPVTISGIDASPYTLTVEEGGTYEILEVSDRYCTAVGTGQVNITIEPAPDVTMSGLNDIYGFDHDPADLSVSPLGGDFGESDFPNAIIPISGTWTFYPSIAYGGFGSPFQVVYAWEDPFTGCIGRAQKTVLIVEEDIEIQVLEPKPAKSRYCFNDDTIKIIGINNLSSDIGSFSIEGGEGLIDVGYDTALIVPSLIQSGTKTVTYSVNITGEGLREGEKDFTFQKVEADFKWDNECFGEESLVNFIDNSDAGGAVLDSHRWAIYYPEEVVFLYGDSISVTFEEMDTYPIIYTVGSEHGCFDTVEQDLVLKPIIDVFESPYAQDFSNGQANWYAYSKQAGGLNSWKFGQPSEEPFNGAGTGAKLWYTNILAGEQSYVISPCYDFSGSERPMIKMNIWREFSPVDGAVLQYTLDNGENWFEVGALDDGINWYNEYGIQGIPGGQGLGWSDEHDGNWVEARHKLDVLEDESIVRFRIAYGAPDGIGLARDGFAFDNIWIGERTKKVLVEHFTNAGDTLCRSDINEKFNDLINSNMEDIIDIQYHLGYPGPDTFNTLNPWPPNAREYYYSLPGIPYGIIDGGRNGLPAYLVNYCEEDLEQLDITLAVLKDNRFNLKVNTTVGDNSLTIDVEVEALAEISGKTLTLQVAILERLIKDVVGASGETRFESVLRDMVPSEQGTSYNRSWSVNDKEYESFDWYYQDVFDEEELRVVVFIQDDATREVYQAEIDNPFVVTSLEEEQAENADQLFLYPNPAVDHTMIMFEEPLVSEAILQLTDNTGRLVYNKKLNRGIQHVDLPLRGMDSGLYIVRLLYEETFYMEKLILIDNN